jgi:hypothetical protein
MKTVYCRSKRKSKTCFRSIRGWAEAEDDEDDDSDEEVDDESDEDDADDEA